MLPWKRKRFLVTIEKGIVNYARKYNDDVNVLSKIPLDKEENDL